MLIERKTYKRADIAPMDGYPKTLDEPMKCPIYSAFLLAFVLNFISAYTKP